MLIITKNAKAIVWGRARVCVCVTSADVLSECSSFVQWIRLCKHIILPATCWKQICDTVVVPSMTRLYGQKKKKKKDKWVVLIDRVVLFTLCVYTEVEWSVACYLLSACKQVKEDRKVPTHTPADFTLFKSLMRIKKRNIPKIPVTLIACNKPNTDPH